MTEQDATLARPAITPPTASEHEINQRLNRVIAIAEGAATRAMSYWHRHSSLQIESKGLQDWVSDADQEIEQQVVDEILAQFPNDAVLGEEYGAVRGNSGYTWIIDPIDGTTNFVNRMSGWAVSIACVDAQGVAVGAIVDPIGGETFSAARGKGAWLNGRPMAVKSASSLSEGSVSTGHNMRIKPEQTLAVLGDLLLQQGMFVRNGSGALHLAWVAAGRLIGYIEAHMNCWDCLAAMLMVQEAGGKVRDVDIETMLAQGGPVVAASPGVYDELARIADQHFH